MTPDPIVLATPAILHRDSQYTVWHAGVVWGPPGIVVVNLDITCTEHQDDWGLPGAAPVEAYIEAPAIPWRVVGENGYGADWFTLKFHARFPSPQHPRREFQPLELEQVTAAQLHIEIRPLDLHLVLELGPRP